MLIPGGMPMLQRRSLVVGLCLALVLSACSAATPATHADPTAVALALTATPLPIGSPTPSVAALSVTREPSRTPRHFEDTQEAIMAASEPAASATPPPTATS